MGGAAKIYIYTVYHEYTWPASPSPWPLVPRHGSLGVTFANPIPSAAFTQPSLPEQSLTHMKAMNVSAAVCAFVCNQLSYCYFVELLHCVTWAFISSRFGDSISICFAPSLSICGASALWLFQGLADRTSWCLLSASSCWSMCVRHQN